jgi:hypothetical protein
MKASYFSKSDPAKNFEMELDTETCLQMLRTLDDPGSLLIVSISNTIQLDFHVGNNSFWLELHEPQCLSAATIDLNVAEEILLAATHKFDNLLARHYLSHLEIDWDYYCEM